MMIKKELNDKVTTKLEADGLSENVLWATNHITFFQVDDKNNNSLKTSEYFCDFSQLYKSANFEFKNHFFFV